MMPALIHAALFLCVATAIVTLGVCYSDAADPPARRNWPKRMFTFLLGCAILVAVMLVCEHTFAALG